MAIASKFDIYDIKSKCYVKRGCTLEDMIPPFHTLTDDEVRKYFKIDESNMNWKRAHNSIAVRRYVFNNCIVPDNIRYRIDPVGVQEEDEDEEK